VVLADLPVSPGCVLEPVLSTDLYVERASGDEPAGFNKRGPPAEGTLCR
jgi:hypothetical protein